MPAEGLKKTVLDRARAEAAEIEERARRQVEEILSSARREAERLAAEIVERARAAAASARSRALSALSRETRLSALEAKNRLLDEVFERGSRAFRETPPEELVALYKRELSGLDLAGATVLVPPGRAPEMERALEGRARVAEDPALDAGYVVSREDFRLDRTLAARLAEAREELRAELAQMLFGGPS